MSAAATNIEWWSHHDIVAVVEIWIVGLEVGLNALKSFFAQSLDKHVLKILPEAECCPRSPR